MLNRERGRGVCLLGLCLTGALGCSSSGAGSMEATPSQTGEAAAVPPEKNVSLGSGSTAAAGSVARLGTGGTPGAVTPSGQASPASMSLGTAGSGTAPAAGSAGMLASGAPAGSSETSAAAAGASGASAAGVAGAESASSSEPEPAACPADSSIAPGDTNLTIEVGGMQRRYILHVPPGYDGKTPMPMLIDWHPLTQTGAYQRRSSGYAALGDKEGFVTLFPDGINNAWNIGPCCTQSRDVDDLGFAKALVERMRTEACIDMKRVYAAGFSMGGGMTHYLGCNAADLFAAISPAAFDLLEEDEEPCHPARPITVIAFRGTADPIVPYQGGASTPPTAYPLDPIHFRGAKGTFEHWAELNGCTDSPSMGSGGCETYKQCKNGVEVTLCTKNGGSHETGDANVGWETLKRFSL